MAVFQRSLVSDDAMPALIEGVLATLDRVGILCQSAPMRDALLSAGATRGTGPERIHFPPDMVEGYVESFRAEFGSDSGRPSGLRRPHPPCLTALVAQRYFDYPSGEKRLGNRRDLITLIQLADVLHPETPAGHALLLADAAPMLEPLEAAMLLAEYAHDAEGAFAWHVDQFDYLVEMGELLGKRDWYEPGAFCISHPLRFDAAVAARFVRCAIEGRAVGLTAMPVAGATAPVTAEGFVVVASAEMVAAWIAARALNPRVPLAGSMWPGTVDLSSGRVSFSAPDAMHNGFAAVEFLRRWTGIETPVGGGEYCDSSEPGLYAVMEKAYKAMMIAAFTGRHPDIGQGMLECGKTVCPAQLLLEREFTEGLRFPAEPVRGCAEAIGLDAIMEVGLGFETSHIETRHTLRHFRESVWLPRLWPRAAYEGPEAERALLDRAQRRVDDLLAAYVKPEGREDQLAAMRCVVERARDDFSRR